MTRKHWIEIGPSIILAAGIIVSTLIAVLPSDSGWLVGVGSVLFAISILGADVLISRLHGESLVPSPHAIVMAAAFLAACGMVALGDPRLVAPLIPVLGGSATIVLLRSKVRSSVCGRV